MWYHTVFSELVNTKYPMVQAPMAGIGTTALAGTVSECGLLGSMGCAEMTVPQLYDTALTLREITDAPFNLNFFAHSEPDSYHQVDSALIETLTPLYEKHSLPFPKVPLSAENTSFTEEKLKAVLEIKPKVISFHFGLPDTHALDALRNVGCLILCSATTVDEAVYLEKRGVDAIIAQGWEAGGHRGSFKVNNSDAGIGTMALVPQIVDKVRLPVIAAGGIGDGRGIAAAMLLGASGVQMGSAFLGCPETALPEAYATAIRQALETDTRLTRGFSGRPARAQQNLYTRSFLDQSFKLPNFPLMYEYSEPLIDVSTANGDDKYAYHLYGQAASLNRGLPAAQFIEGLINEVNKLLNR